MTRPPPKAPASSRHHALRLLVLGASVAPRSGTACYKCLEGRMRLPTRMTCAIQNPAGLVPPALPCGTCPAGGRLERLGTWNAPIPAELHAAGPDRIEVIASEPVPPGAPVLFECGSVLIMGEVAENMPAERGVHISIGVSHLLSQPVLDNALASGWAGLVASPRESSRQARDS